MRSVLARAAPEKVGAVGVAGTAIVHGSVALLILAAGRVPKRPLPLPAYRVELVAAPVAAGLEAAPEARPSVSTPAPPAPRPAETAPRTRAPAAPIPRSTPPPPARPAPAAVPRSAETPRPGTTQGRPGGIGSDAATIRTEGVEFPFPGYLRNLVAQVYRRWRPPEGNANLEAEILFLVHRDGSISDIQFVRRSGSFGFDLEAQGAIEAAGRSGSFGPLPTGYGAELLPVSFYFSPRSLR